MRTLVIIAAGFDLPVAFRGADTVLCKRRPS